jgi:RimJ/RimL family protein N-acetyltransferase
VIPERLETARLVLRPLAEADAPALVEALADWQVVKWLAVVPWPYTAADASWFVAANAAGGSLRERGERTWVIAPRDDPARLLGVMGLGEELGYWLAAEAWGRGLATEAARTVLAAHFADENGGNVASGWFDGNERSERVLRKLGFEDMGVRTRGCLARGEDVLSHEMRLTRARFAAA